MEFNALAKKDDTELLKKIINILIKTTPKGDHGYYMTNEAINLIIRPECNQRCDYCYITQHGKELYPIRLDKEHTLHNVELFLDYILNQEKIMSDRWELFAGELFYDDIFFDIMDLFEKYFKPIHDKYPEIFHPPYKQGFWDHVMIMIPANLSFVYYEPEKAKKVIALREHFLKEYDVDISFSWSSDGPYAIDSREKKELNKDYFDKILDFCIKTETGFHPMIAPENIHSWIESYDWWIEACEKLNIGTNHLGDFQPYLLDVRNDNWTDETIQGYCKLLEHIMEVRFKKICKSDIDILAKNLFACDLLPDEYSMNGCDPIKLTYQGVGMTDTAVESPSCSLYTGIHFNCTNLSLVPCHRLAYPNLTAGYFITDENNEHIIDIEANNVSLFTCLRTLKSWNMPLCSKCDIYPICLQGCNGAQFEYSGDPLLPIPSLCHFFHKKYSFLIKLYEKYGLFDYAYKNNFLEEKIYKYYKQILAKILKEEEENGTEGLAFKLD